MRQEDQQRLDRIFERHRKRVMAKLYPPRPKRKKRRKVYDDEMVYTELADVANHIISRR